MEKLTAGDENKDIKFDSVDSTSAIDPEIVAASETAVIVSVPNIPITHRKLFPIIRSNGAKYSPEEWELRERNGILSKALRESQRRHSFTFSSFTVKGNGKMDNNQIPDRHRRTTTIIDSSDEEYRYGILGKSLERIRVFEVNGKIGSDDEIRGERDKSRKYKSKTLKTDISSDGEIVPSEHLRGGSLGSDDDEIEILEKRSQNFTEEEIREIKELESLQIHGGDNSTALLLEAKKGNWQGVKDLLSREEPIDLTLADQNGYTPLLLSVKSGELGVLKMLIERGADLYATTKTGRMGALHVCASWGTKSMMHYLLASNLDTSKPAMEGRLPIHFASSRDSPCAVAIMKMLIQVNPDYRIAVDKNGTLPLHCAVRAGNMSAVQFLLQKDQKKQVSTKDSDGNTPLHLATQKGNEFVQVIVENGGGEEVNTRNAKGRTPLHEAY